MLMQTANFSIDMLLHQYYLSQVQGINSLFSRPLSRIELSSLFFTHFARTLQQKVFEPS